MNFERLLIGGGTLVGFLLVWELCADFGAINPLFISSPSRIAQAGAALMADPDFWNDVRVSAREFILGYVAAIVIGIPFGLFMGTSRRLSYIVAPFVDTLNAVPRVTLLPLLIIWFGIGIWSKVAVVFLGALFPLLINTYEGVRNADKLLINVVRSFGAGEWDIARLVVVPNSLPFIIVGLRLAIGRAVLGVVVSEFFGSQDGLGVVMVRAASEFKVDVVFAGLIVFAALSLIMTGLVKLIENRLTRWRPQHSNAG